MTKTSFVAEPGKQEIVMTRVFRAPRTRVFQAVTDPALIPRWWGPRNLTTTVERMDVRQGGVWRFIQRDAAGAEYAFHGVYHLAQAPKRLVRTFEFEGMPGRVLLETVTFDDLGGSTRMTSQAVFQSVADRDAMIGSGAERGGVESWDRLGEVLERLPV